MSTEMFRISIRHYLPMTRYSRGHRWVSQLLESVAISRESLDSRSASKGLSEASNSCAHQIWNTPLVDPRITEDNKIQ